MSQPPAYIPQTEFLVYQAQQAWFPGQQLDVEFNDLGISIAAIRANLALIQKDDGTLGNGTVGFDQLSPSFQIALRAQGFTGAPSSGPNTWLGLQTFPNGLTAPGNVTIGTATATWPLTYFMPVANQAALSAIDPIGEVALYVAGRSSDWNTNTFTTNSIPFTLLSVHDRVTTSPQPTGTWGAYWQFNKTATASTLQQQGVEMSFQNLGASFTTDPYGAQPVTGGTCLMTLDSGIGPAVGNPVTAALRILNNGNTFNSGIVFGAGSLAAGGLAIQMPINYGITWYTGAATPGLTITGSTSLFARLPGASYGNVYTWASGAGDVIGFIGAMGTNQVTFGSLTSAGLVLLTHNIAALTIDTSQNVTLAAALNVNTLNLGASGTLGQAVFGNATSGTITVKPGTGVLGTVTLSLPDFTDTLAVLAGAQTLTNKTIAFSSNTLTGVAPLASPTFTGTLTAAIGTFTGKVSTPASTTGGAGFLLPAGSGPTSPVDGEMWQDGTNVKIRIGSTTKTFTIT